MLMSFKKQFPESIVITYISLGLYSFCSSYLFWNKTVVRKDIIPFVPSNKVRIRQAKKKSFSQNHNKLPVRSSTEIRIRVWAQFRTIFCTSICLSVLRYFQENLELFVGVDREDCICYIHRSTCVCTHCYVFLSVSEELKSATFTHHFIPRIWRSLWYINV